MKSVNIVLNENNLLKIIKCTVVIDYTDLYFKLLMLLRRSFHKKELIIMKRNRKERILLEIGGIDRQIEEYRSNILELEEKYKQIKISYNNIVEKAYTPAKNYDFSDLSIYGEAAVRQAEAYKKKFVESTENGLRDTLVLLSDIQRIQQKINSLITECENKKKTLKAELAKLSAT